MLLSSYGTRLRALDGLRGLCACLVMLYHMEFLRAGVPGWAFFRHGFLFVDFFFVLSGFVITRTYAARLAEGMPLRRFLAGRVATIYPLYLIVLILIPIASTGAMLAGFRPQIAGARGIEDLWTWAVSALMLQGLVLYSPLIWNVPGWSVAAEMMTYLICGGLMRLAGRALPWLMALAWALAIGVLLAAAPTIEVFDRLGLARCLYGFTTGHFAYRLHRRGVVRIADAASTAAEIVLTIAVIAFVVAAAKTAWSLAAPVLFAAAILLHAEGRGRLSALWAWPPLARIGDWSYAVYICHFPLAMRIARPVTKRLLTPDRMADFWVATLLAAALGMVTLAMAALLAKKVQPPLKRATESLFAGLSGPAAAISSHYVAPHLDPAPDHANLAPLATGERVAG